MTDPIRIVLFTVDDLEFVPDLLEPVIAAWRPALIKAYVSRSFDAGYFFRRSADLLLKGYPFCIRPPDLLNFFGMTFGLSGEGRRRGARSMVDFLRQRGIPADPVREIDSEPFLQELRGLEADLFLFGCFDKIAKPPFLGIPRIGTFNVHMGKLPEYRGRFSAFWVLRTGDATAGITVHRAVEKLDAGEIIAETRFPVTTCSMFRLMHETFCRGGATINAALSRLQSGNWMPIKPDGRPEAYLGIPKPNDFRALYARGCRLF